MRLLHMTHPDQVDELPMEFVAWVLAFAATETQAQADANKAATKT